MSKIGRKPIELGAIKVNVEGQTISFTGKKQSGSFVLPHTLKAEIVDNKLKLVVNTEKVTRADQKDLNRVWGLNRALLANSILGSENDFEKKLEINGLGFKAAVSGSKVVFNLGYSHKIDFELPKEVSMEVDKTGQKITLKSSDKEKLGLVASQIRFLRPPEPYKGTGIKYANEQIARKAGKTKA